MATLHRRRGSVPLPELKCTQSDAHFVLRDGAAGLFLAASNFPKSRETRAPLVEELKRFAIASPQAPVPGGRSGVRS